MSKLSFRARALDASKPMPIYLAEELPDLPDYSAINRAVPQMPSGMEKEEESEHHLQRAISGTGLIIPTPEVCSVNDLEFYERCYPPDYKMPKQHIHMQPLWEEQEAPEYDIDTEDERWLKQQGHPELTELKFEQMMDKLEKSSGQTVVTLNEAKLLLERHDDLVIAVYDYWLNKRLNTQHPLILSVKTESRPGQSSNNPYLAFRRRTEKMQTRKNRKNDESSYEKMLKLRRDLARALTLLELVARRERAKRDLLKLTSLLAERRYVAKDFASQLLPEPPPRPQYTVPLAPSYRRDAYPAPHYPPHYPPRPAPPVDQPRQREKRPYKRRKHRHHTGATLRESGVYTSSEEESLPVEATPPDDGRYAFRRKPGCFYEMPTSTLNGDPVDPEDLSGMYQHEIDVRHRYTLTSVNTPYRHCVGFARRRMGRGGRVALDRVETAHRQLYTSLPYTHAGSGVERLQRQEEIDLETRAHRMPKELSRDYHTSGKHPWRHEFRKHLAKNPDVWVAPVKNDVEDLKIEVDVDTSDIKIDSEMKMDTSEMKIDAGEVKLDAGEVKMDTGEVKMDVCDVKIEPSDTLPDVVNKSDIRVSAKTIDSAVRGNLEQVMRKRSWSGSDCSYDSDDSLLPVEQEFEKVYNEIKKKWLHFRPKTPPPSPPLPESTDDQFPLATDTAITVELRTQRPTDGLDLFTTSQFSLNDIYPELADVDNGAASLDISGDDLISENLGLTEAQVESILSDADLRELAEVDDKRTEDFLAELVREEGRGGFLCSGRGQGGAGGPGRGQGGAGGPGRGARGCTTVSVAQDRETIYVDKIQEKIVAPPPKKPVPATPRAHPAPAPQPAPPPAQPAATPAKPAATPAQPAQVAAQPARSAPPVAVNEHVEEINVQLSHGVKIQTLHAKNSPVKKHIISTAPRDLATSRDLVTSRDLAASRDLVTSRDIVTSAVPPTVAQVQASPVITQVPQALKVRLQNQLAVSQAGVVNFVQNGPYTAVMPLPLHSREPGASSVSARRPLVLAPRPLAPAHLHHMQPNKLKVLHAHPLTQTQRQLLTNRNIAQLPAVVSLATLGENKNTALLKAAPGSVTQFFEIKSGQLGKPHLVNVIRQPQPKTVARLDLIDKRKVVATFDGTLKGNLATSTRPHRVSVSLDGRQIVRAATLPSVRPQVRHQIQLKNRTLQVGPRSSTDPSTSITISAPTKTASIPSSVVANLLQKNVQIPKGQKIAISGPGGQALSANVQAIAFTTAQLKARQARLIAQPRPTPVAEIVEATTVPTTSSSTNLQQETSHEATEDEASTNGVRRRPTDTLPMEVT